MHWITCTRVNIPLTNSSYPWRRWPLKNANDILHSMMPTASYQLWRISGQPPLSEGLRIPCQPPQSKGWRISWIPLLYWRGGESWPTLSIGIVLCSKSIRRIHSSYYKGYCSFLNWTLNKSIHHFRGCEYFYYSFIVQYFTLMCIMWRVHSQDTRDGLYYNRDSHVTLMSCADSNVTSQGRIIFAWYQLIVMFAFPVLVIAYCYVVVIVILWLSTKELDQLTGSQRRAHTSSQKSAHLGTQPGAHANGYDTFLLNFSFQNSCILHYIIDVANVQTCLYNFWRERIRLRSFQYYF